MSRPATLTSGASTPKTDLEAFLAEEPDELAVELGVDPEEVPAASEAMLELVGPMVAADVLGPDRAPRCTPEQVAVIAKSRAWRSTDEMLDAYVATAELNERAAEPALLPAREIAAPARLSRRSGHRGGRSRRPGARRRARSTERAGPDPDLPAPAPAAPDRGSPALRAAGRDRSELTRTTRRPARDDQQREEVSMATPSYEGGALVGASEEVVAEHLRRHECEDADAGATVCPCGLTVAVVCMSCDLPLFMATAPGSWCEHADALWEWCR